jgi:hypothetical protein
MARPIPSMASVFGKKRDLVSKSWSDLWDEEEEENAGHSETENDFNMPTRGRVQDWNDESDGRDTPRQALKELKNPATVNNSRNRTPEVAHASDDFVSECTGFIFEDHDTSMPVTPNTQRYSPPSKRSALDKWAALGDRRRAHPTPSKTPSSTSSAPPRKRSRAGSWRARNIDWNSKHHSHNGNEIGVLEQHERIHSGGKNKDLSSLKVEPWTLSKDWRQHASPQQEDDVHDIEWVWRHDLHL